RARARGPTVLEVLAVDPANVDAVERAGDRVEPRGIDDHVEFEDGIAGLDPARRDPLDRRLAHVDQTCVRLIVDLIVAALQRYAPGAEPVVPRSQRLGHGWIAHALLDLLPHERGDRVIGVLVDQDVAKVPHPDAEAWLAVPLLVERLTDL